MVVLFGLVFLLIFNSVGYLFRFFVFIYFYFVLLLVLCGCFYFAACCLTYGCWFDIVGIVGDPLCLVCLSVFDLGVGLFVWVMIVVLLGIWFVIISVLWCLALAVLIANLLEYLFVVDRFLRWVLWLVWCWWFKLVVYLWCFVCFSIWLWWWWCLCLLVACYLWLFGCRRWRIRYLLCLDVFVGGLCGCWWLLVVWGLCVLFGIDLIVLCYSCGILFVVYLN